MIEIELGGPEHPVSQFYRHVRDGHGQPLVGEWSLTQLLDTHEHLHNLHNERRERVPAGHPLRCIHEPVHDTVWACPDYTIADIGL